MFSDLGDVEKYLIYKALVMMIEANSGVGFHNSDQGHPAYRMGASDGMSDSNTWGDGPEQNRLFKILVALNPEFLEDSSIGPDLTTWQKFCTFATNSYDRKRSE